MLRRVLALALATAFIWPGAVPAQEMGEEEPSRPMLMISSWKCDFGDMGAIADNWEQRALPASQSVVDGGGTWASAGVFYHAWADEWNVNYWAIADDIPDLIAGQEAMNAAYAEMYPEDESSLWDYCDEHKDSFYAFGQWTEDADDEMEDEDEAPGMIAISSWKCTDVPAVDEAWESTYLPKAQAVVDAGGWEGAGVYYHAWAEEWNVNFYYMADDIPTILSGWQTYVDSFEDGDPDLTEYCHAHKDGLYAFGPETEGADEGDD